MDFLWHKVSEKEKESIKKQAKKIMDDFSKKLSKVGGSKGLKEMFIERDECERDENECEEECSFDKDKIDRKIMFDNAPKSNKDFIVAEKKKW